MEQRYKNLAGDSGVLSFEIRADSIIVTFVGGARYLYDRTKPGLHHVSMMKRLAEAGRGLASYIARNVKKEAVKLR